MNGESKVSAEHLTRKPYINWAVMRVTRALQVLWPRSRTNIFGSCATGLALPTSDVDLVVSLPPVRNLVRHTKLGFLQLCYAFIFGKHLSGVAFQEPIKEDEKLEGRNGIKETYMSSGRLNNGQETYTSSGRFSGT